MFAAWGRLVHRQRWVVLAMSIVLLAVSVVALLEGGKLTSGGPLTSNLESARAAKLVADDLRHDRSSGSTVLLVLSSPSLSVTDAGFRSALDDAVAPLRSDRRVKMLVTPYDAPPEQAAGLISRDGHAALVRVGLGDGLTRAEAYYPQLRAEVHSSALRIEGTGQLPINRAFNSTLESDLGRAEVISLPVTLLLLLVIFGSVVAALLPLGVGILAIVGGVGATLLLARFSDVSQYALNIVTLIGLAVAIDYSLFIVNRFRDELKAGAGGEDALAITMATAGRAVTFSGVTVAIGLSAMLFYQGTFMASMGAAGALVVGIAVLYALTFLPALLAAVGGRVERLRLPVLQPRPEGQGMWSRLAQRVMMRPVVVLLPTLGFLLLAGTPFLHLRMANGDVEMLPPRLEARQGFDRLLRDFPGQDSTLFNVVVQYPAGDPLAPGRVGDQYDLGRRLAAVPGVQAVRGLTSADPSLSRADYQRLYSQPVSQLPPEIQTLYRQSAGSHIVLMTLTSSRAASSDGARRIVDAIRQDPGVPGGRVLVTGQTAFDVDVIRFIQGRTPLAVGFVVLVTCLVFFLLTGSVVLPLKAVLMNLVSISASFGALVWIFQDGHLSHLLGFTPQSIDPSIPVILFSIVFGMSMDYEVLLVSRIQEEWRRTGDNRRAVATGLERSGRLITGAAAIMVAVFASFGLAEVVIIKAIGIGLAIAVALDATVVRALIVPAVMRLLGPANWWAPRPLAWLHRVIGAGASPPRREPRPAPGSLLDPGPTLASPSK